MAAPMSRTGQTQNLVLQVAPNNYLSAEELCEIDKRICSKTSELIQNGPTESWQRDRIRGDLYFLLNKKIQHENNILSETKTVFIQLR